MDIGNGRQVDVKEYIADKDELERDRELPHHRRLDLSRMGEKVKDDPSGDDDDVSADDRDGEPCGNKAIEGEEDKGCDKKKFVCKGIQKSSEERFLVLEAGNEPIEHIGESGDDKEIEGIIVSQVDD